MHIVKRFLAISFALLILLSNMGFTFTTHYCGGHAVQSKLMIGLGDLGCGMESMDNSCESLPDQESLKPKACCDNDFITFDIEDEYNSGIEKISIDTKFAFSFIYTFYQLNLDEANQIIALSDHPPPLLERDIQSLYQTFLL